MPREIPRRAFGWRVGRKVYATELSAYYKIAKAIVVERYHPMIDSAAGWDDENVAGALGISVAELERRRTRMDALFGSQGEFDRKRWIAFVRRLARFLRFVDRKRTDEEQLRALGAEELDREYNDTERFATDAANRLPLIARIAKERKSA